jgi:phenylpyruvate tautomerase PptA (4-oxalocrotonate tautomerase family)
MPLVRIDVLGADSRTTRQRLGAIGDAVHQAMTETINVPRDDRFQIVNAHGPAGVRYDPDYLNIHRDDGIALISITMGAGRTDEQKQALYRRITELTAAQADVEPRNVLIALTENQWVDWSFGEGVAQMVDRPRR